MKIPTEMVEQFKRDAEFYLAGRGYKLTDVTVGSDAWLIAHHTKFSHECYCTVPHITDAHIVTALKQVFPNVEFRDKYHY